VIELYNIDRPHSALGYLQPAVFAAKPNAMSDQFRAPVTPRRSRLASLAQQRQIQ
jgi:hypothetical protein